MCHSWRNLQSATAVWEETKKTPSNHHSTLREILEVLLKVALSRFMQLFIIMQLFIFLRTVILFCAHDSPTILTSNHFSFNLVFACHVIQNIK